MRCAEKRESVKASRAVGLPDGACGMTPSILHNRMLIEAFHGSQRDHRRKRYQEVVHIFAFFWSAIILSIRECLGIERG